MQEGESSYGGLGLSRGGMEQGHMVDKAHCKMCIEGCEEEYQVCTLAPPACTPDCDCNGPRLPQPLPPALARRSSPSPPPLLPPNAASPHRGVALRSRSPPRGEGETSAA